MHLDRRASSESRFEHITRIDLNRSGTQFDRRALSESDLQHIGDAHGAAPLACFARHASHEHDLRISGSKNLLQRIILYRHKKILCRQGDGEQYQAETICDFEMVI